MSDGRARLFVALELPRSAHEAFVRWRGDLDSDAVKGLRPIASDALHVTLCFLGWRAEDEISAIAAACGVVASEPAPALSVGASLWLPRRRPRVLAVELSDPSGRLRAMQTALAGALAAGGWYEPESRPYLAHVTVARVKAGAGGLRAPELPAPPRLEFVASRVVLYRSRLSHAGARYEPLAGVELAGS